MDIGKQILRSPRVYLGDPEQAHKDAIAALNVLRAEQSISPGTCTLLAGETITKGQAIHILAGVVMKADAATSKAAIGIATSGAAVGKSVRFILGMGLATDLTGLTADSSVYLGNAGALVFVKPGSGFIQGLGRTLSTTDLFVTISQP